MRSRGGRLMGSRTTIGAKTNGLNATAATLRPLADRVVAKPLAREEMTKSGIMLPDTAKEKPMRGTVIAAGEGRRTDDGVRIPLEVQVGDQILFTKYGGAEFTLDGEELLILAEKDVLAVVAS
jgi:chaperonin GroES